MRSLNIHKLAVRRLQLLEFVKSLFGRIGPVDVGVELTRTLAEGCLDFARRGTPLQTKGAIRIGLLHFISVGEIRSRVDAGGAPVRVRVVNVLVRKGPLCPCSW